MKPVATLFVALIVLVAVTLFLFRSGGPEVVISDAALVPMGQGHALILSIDNPGAPTRIEAVTIKDTPAILTESRPLIVPGADTAALAMDGAHAMAMGLQGGEGELVPITVTFADGSAAATRARISATTEMDHSVLFEVPEGEPRPSLDASITQDGALWRVTLETNDFTFSQDAVDGAHTPGVGHAHLYLNGLKLGRIFGETAELGALPSGTHEVSVVLNTNDHQGYAVDGEPVAITLPITVD